MRVFLTQPELETEAGKHLLQLCLRSTADGKLDLEEIKELRRWLRENQGTSDVVAVAYLYDIMQRITVDGLVDKDELVELHLAVERVIPTAQRTAAIQARRQREAIRRERRREQRRLEAEREAAERKRIRDEEYARAMRLRHCFAKVAGVTFPNEDGTERQLIIARCSAGEPLLLQHDAYNQYSVFATKVLRTNGEQLGHVPEYLAERVLEAMEDGYYVYGNIAAVTGGTWEKPTRGVNIAIFFVAKDVPQAEFDRYARSVLDEEWRNPRLE